MSQRNKPIKANKPLKIPRSNYKYRDLPCFKSINVAYWLLYNFSEYDKEELNDKFIESTLLMWYKNGNISIYHSGMDKYRIDLKNGDWEKSESEKIVFWIFKDVAENYNLLENDKISLYYSSEENNKKLEKVIDRVMENTTRYLEAEKYIMIVPPEKHFLYEKEEQFVLSKQLKNEYKRLMGLKNYLSNEIITEDKKSCDVDMWEDYYIFANLLGIGENVRRQFFQIKPNYNLNGTILGTKLNLNLFKQDIQTPKGKYKHSK